MKKTLTAILILAISTMSFTACGTTGKGEATLEKTSKENISVSEEDPDEEESIDSSSASDVLGVQNEYGYPESVASDEAPKPWYVYADEFMLSVPGVYKDAGINPGSFSTHYLSYEKDDFEVYFYSMCQYWTETKPDWMDSETYDKSLKDAPEFLKDCLLDVFENYGAIDHISPFTKTNTDYTIYDESIVTIDGRDYIRQEVMAYGHGFGKENTMYYTIYYGLMDLEYEGSVPFFAVAMSLSGSDEARRIMNDTVDYAMQHAVI
ncbi:MAG: hypothetical protein J6Y08_01245 [Clostridiales bacterium]|nr:hypothetical protein [Clostridiales bacterium]